MNFADSELELSLDLGTTPEAQTWLYKEGDAVRGPVKSALIIDLIKAGHIDADSNISPEFGEWQLLREVDQFSDILEKASAALTEKKNKLKEQQRQRRIGLIRIAMFIIAVLVFFIGGFAGGRYLAKTRPWADKTDWSRKPPALVALSAKKIVLAKATTTAWDIAAFDEEEEEKPAAKNSTSKASASGQKRKSKSGKKSRNSAKGKSSNSKKASKNKSPNKSKETKVAAAPTQEYNSAGLPRALTQSQIMRVLKTKKGAIAGCLRAEAKRNPDMPATVTMEFVVTSAGTPSGFKIRERQVRTGPLATCIKAKVMMLRWPRFFGANKTVTIPFNIRRH